MGCCWCCLWLLCLHCCLTLTLFFFLHSIDYRSYKPEDESPMVKVRNWDIQMQDPYERQTQEKFFGCKKNVCWSYCGAAWASGEWCYKGGPGNNAVVFVFVFFFFFFFFAPTHNTNIFSNLTISSGFFSSAKTKALSNQRPLGTDNKDWAYCNTWEDCEFYMPCFGGCAITRL